MKKYKLKGDFSAPFIGLNRLHLKEGSIVETDADYRAFPELLEEIKETCSHARANKDLLKDGQMLCPDCGACYAIKPQSKERKRILEETLKELKEDLKAGRYQVNVEDYDGEEPQHTPMCHDDMCLCSQPKEKPSNPDEQFTKETSDQEKKFYMQIDKALAMRKAGIRGIKSI